MRVDNQNTRVNLITLGCAKNVVDSEVLLGQLKANQRIVGQDATIQENDTVIVNTCGFVEHAKQESIDTILDCVELKESGFIKNLYVMGCLSERYKADLVKEIPQVDEYFGTKDIRCILKTLGANYQKELVGERLLSTPAHYAYLRISDGCDRKCSFCAIPLMRGQHISVPIEDLVREAKTLANKGVKELILIAQELTFYGIDLYGKRELPQLIDALSTVEGIEWIRLHYAYPSGFPLEVFDTMSSNPKVCHYLDIPLQHISQPIMDSMRRGGTKQKVHNLITTARERVPNLTLRTTLIVGYPGETEAEFCEMLDWVEEVKFDRLGVFTYSHEEQTHAYEQYEDTVSEQEKESRKERLMELQHDISYTLNQQKVGTKPRVLIDQKIKDGYLGRTEADSPEVDNTVFVSTQDHLEVGDFVQVEILEADAYDLTAKLITQQEN